MGDRIGPEHALTGTVLYKNFLEAWRNKHPDQKNDTQRKNARNQLKKLNGKGVIEWVSPSEEIIVFPSIHSMSIA